MACTEVLAVFSKTHGLLALGLPAALLVTSCGTSAPPSAPPPPSALTSQAPATSASSPAGPGSPGASNAVSGTYDIGGQSLFLECHGSGPSAVIFLVGSGAPRTQMQTIADAVEDRARVCTYDRRPQPTDLDEDHVDDLAALLKAASIDPPYVLVGQSVGGNIAWLFASRHPEEVDGFMLMNAGPFLLDWKAMAKVWTPEELADEVPPAGSSREANGLMLQAAPPPADTPYVVMLSTIAQCGSPDDICGRFYPAYEAWGRELAKRSPAGRFVQVEASHEIFAERPDAIIDELVRLLEVRP